MASTRGVPVPSSAGAASVTLQVYRQLSRKRVERKATGVIGLLPDLKPILSAGVIDEDCQQALRRERNRPETRRAARRRASVHPDARADRCLRRAVIDEEEHHEDADLQAMIPRARTLGLKANGRALRGDRTGAPFPGPRALPNHRKAASKAETDRAAVVAVRATGVTCGATTVAGAATAVARAAAAVMAGAAAVARAAATATRGATVVTRRAAPVADGATAVTYAAVSVTRAATPFTLAATAATAGAATAARSMSVVENPIPDGSRLAAPAESAAARGSRAVRPATAPPTGPPRPGTPRPPCAGGAPGSAGAAGSSRGACPSPPPP